MGDSAPSQRTKVKRAAQRAIYDKDHVYTILDEGLVAHVGIVQDGLPVVIPMGYARMGNDLLLHGSISSRLMKVSFCTSPVLSTASCVQALLGICPSVRAHLALQGISSMQAMTAGTEVCVNVTVLDGLVLARSPFHHSMNYRSVVAFGRPQVTWVSPGAADC